MDIDDLSTPPTEVDFPELDATEKKAAPKKKPVTPRKRKVENDDGGSLEPGPKKAAPPGKCSPMPKTKQDIQDYDLLLMDLKKQGLGWDDIMTQYLAAGGMGSKESTRKRLPKLNALDLEMGDDDIANLRVIYNEVEEAFRKTKFAQIAASMKEKHGLDLKANVLQKKWEELEKAKTTSAS